MSQVILVAGATGNLGMRIVKSLRTQHAEVRVFVRTGVSAPLFRQHNDIIFFN